MGDNLYGRAVTSALGQHQPIMPIALNGPNTLVSRFAVRERGHLSWPQGTESTIRNEFIQATWYRREVRSQLFIGQARCLARKNLIHSTSF